MNTLTHEQRFVFDKLIEGKNVFCTGGGGVGKSYLMSVIRDELPIIKKRLTNKNFRVQLCALTGCAALLLGHKAKTLHSWSGIGLGKGDFKELYIKVRRNAKAMRNWLCTDLLVIDEVSMLTNELLDKLDQLGRKIRAGHSHIPFGGIQLLLVGDFYQLPPINKGDSKNTVFAFESPTWQDIVDVSIELTELQRQKDPLFQKILREARIGELSMKSIEMLTERQNLEWNGLKIKPTLLFPRRAEVEMINEANIKALKGKRKKYDATIVFDGKTPVGFSAEDPDFVRALELFDTDAPYLKRVELAENAQVMLISNMFPDDGLVNGSRGVILRFCEVTGLPVVEFMNGVVKTVGNQTWELEDYEGVLRSQVPLRLAYAVTIHKCQGATLDCALADIGSGVFEYGQAYVALSRVRSLESLYVYDFVPTAFRAHPKVKEFYKAVRFAEIPVEYGSDDAFEMRNGVKGEIGKAVEKEEEGEEERIAHFTFVLPSEIAPTVTITKKESEVTESAISNWLFDSIPSSWKETMAGCENKLAELSVTLATKDFLPRKCDIWRALELTPLDKVRIVILGQDPYPTPGNAHGLAFSVERGVKPLPASLKNIYKEIGTDLGLELPAHGNLESWAKQGVLLLNTVLTVEAGSPQSHSKIGWETVTDEIMRAVCLQNRSAIFVLWGKSAQAKKKLINSLGCGEFRIIESAHPSPLSARTGFFGSKPFSKINDWLKTDGGHEINWIPE
jgi:ATP-dependent DNA helicase PIF1